MIGGLIMLAGTLGISTIFYGIGRIHGYDQCEKDSVEFNVFWKELEDNGLTPRTER